MGKRKAASLVAGPSKKLKTAEKRTAVNPKTFSALPVDESEESFPRGGQSTLTPLERKTIQQRAREDVLFGGGAEADGGDEEDMGVERERVRGKLPTKRSKSTAAVLSKKPSSTKRLDLLSLKKLAPGVLVLGAVLEVRDFEVLVSLPYNLRGSIAITDVSDPLTAAAESEARRLDGEEDETETAEGPETPRLERLFQVGSLLPCYVMAVDGRKVALSVNPRLVNSNRTPRDIAPGLVLPGWVKSIEDHGYIIEFGVEGKTGFLLKNNASEFIKSGNRGKPLSLGQVLQCLVLLGSDSRTTSLSISPGAVAGSLVPGDSLVSLPALLPGMLVNATVKEVAPNGLLVTFLGSFSGAVGVRHLPEGETSTEDFQPKKKFKARLLWVDVPNKTMGLTLQKRVVAGRAFEFQGTEIGDIFQDAPVIHTDQHSSLLLDLGGGMRGYAPLALVYDDKQESLGREYRKGTRHACRVIQFNLLDGVAIVSLQPSVLEKPYFKYSDIKIGEVVEGTVEKHGDYGMIVSLSDAIRGLCPRIHMSDVRLKQPKKKHKEGSKVKCRVLHVASAERRLLLSCKKSFIRSPHDPLCEYSQAKPGGVHTGVVSSVRDYGCVVRFFGNVKGLVTKSELSSSQVIATPSSHFWPEQSVECKILRCEPASEKLLLSMRLDSPLPVEVAEEKALSPGSFVDMEVTGIVSSGLNLRCPETGELSHLPTMHLSDWPHLCLPLLKMHQSSLERALRQGVAYTLEGVLVVCGKLNLRPALVSMKRSLHQFAREPGFVREFSELKPGLALSGFVRKLMPYGCFVEFPHNLSGLAPTKYFTDEFLSDPASTYREMQSVRAKVLEVEETQGRFLLSLRPSDLKLGYRLEEEEVGRRLVADLLSHFEQRDAILREMAASKVNADPLAGGQEADIAELFHPGRCITGRVSTVQEETVILELPGGVVGRATTATAQGASLEEGSEVACCMLDVDLADSHVVVSLNPKLAEADGSEESGHEKKKRRKSKKIKQDLFQLSSSLTATVELVTPHYLLCACSTLTGARLACGVIDTGQIGVLPSSLKYVKPGQQVSTVVQSVASPFRGLSTGGLPIVVVTGTPATDLKLRGAGGKSVAAVMHDVKIGDIIPVTVDSVKTSQLNVKYHLWKGRVHCCLAVDDVKEGSIAFADIIPGDVVSARVLKIRQREIMGKGSKKGASIDVLELTTKPSLLSPSAEFNAGDLLKNSFSSEEEVVGFISEIKENGLQVVLSPKAQAFIPDILASRNLEVLSGLSRHFAEGEAVRCTILSCVKAHQYRASLIGPVQPPSVGCILPARVRNVTSDLGLILAIPTGFGRVDITDISDHYLEEALVRSIGDDGFTRCFVVGIDGDKVDLSLRTSRTGEKLKVEGVEPPEGVASDPEISSLEDLQKGEVVRGYIKAVTDVGAFVHLGRHIDGRVKITHFVDGYVKDFKSLYTVGQLVRAKVLQVDTVKRKIELSLRLSEVDPVAARKARKTALKKAAKLEPRSDGESYESSSEDDSGSSSHEASSSDEEMDQATNVRRSSGSKPSLQLATGGFQWEATPGVVARQPESSSESEEEDESTEPTSKRSRRQKKAALKAEEAHLYTTEQALLETARAPETGEDFDRLLLAHPNSSALWVQYMAFHLHTTEVEKARSVAEKALKTISFREEGEKLNVWVALMNLENLYGTQESLVKVFESALQQNEPTEVFFRLLAIYQSSKKFDLAEQLYQTMVKRFSANLRAWTEFGQFLMKRGKLDAARNLLQRSLKSLSSKQQHVDVISRFAQYEFKYGEPERGRTMFESLLSSYPKRVDLWSVYADMLLKKGDLDAVRELLERAIHLKASAKKIKFLFKRFLDFEKQHGTPAGVEAVKEKARVFVESRTAESKTS